MTTPAEARARLAEQVDLLETVYEATRRRLIDEATRDPFAAMSPEEMCDSNGRPVLLDALTAIVNARTALAQHPGWTPAYNVYAPPQGVRGRRLPAGAPEKVVWEGTARLESREGDPRVVRHVHATIFEQEVREPRIGDSHRVWAESALPRVLLTPARDEAGDVDRSIPAFRPYMPGPLGEVGPGQEWILHAGELRLTLHLDRIEPTLNSGRSLTWQAYMNVVTYQDVAGTW
ncbi:hypothetical protein [Nonomuraea sp. NPDC003214]